MVVRLDDPSCLPLELQQLLEQHGAALSECRDIDDALESPDLQKVVGQIDDYTRTCQLAAYHCTREPDPGHFMTSGLRILDLSSHLAEVLRRVRAAAPDLVSSFNAAYQDWEQSDQIQHREGTLWFCLSGFLVAEPGASRFFEYFGGEAAYWPFDDHDEDEPHLKVLRQLGDPVVVEVQIPATDFTVFPSQPFGRELVSSFARTLNPKFGVQGLEAHLRRTVRPSEVACVHPYAAFTEMVLECSGT